MKLYKSLARQDLACHDLIEITGGAFKALGNRLVSGEDCFHLQRFAMGQSIESKHS